jgi:hypothetical protein
MLASCLILVHVRTRLIYSTLALNTSFFGSVRSQELNPNPEAQPLTPLLLLAHNQRQGEVDLEPCNGMRVHESHACGGTGQLLLEVAQGLFEGLAGVTGEAAVCGFRALEREQAATVDEGLQTQRGFLADAGHGEEQRGASRGEDVAAHCVSAVVRAQPTEAEATHAVGPAQLEAVVYPAGLGLGAAAAGQRVQQAAAQTRGQGDACGAEGDGELRLGLGLEEGGVAAQDGEAGELGDGLHQVAARGQEGVVALVVGPGVGEAGLERVARVAADGGRGVLGERGDLAPDARVAQRVLVARLGAPQELGAAAALHLLVAGPALQHGAREAVGLPLEVRVAQDGRVEGERVGGARARPQRAVCVERLGTAKQVAQLGVDIGVGLGGAGLSARLDGVVAALVGGDVDVDVGGRGGGIGRVGAVEEDRDGRLEDAEAVQLVGGGAHLLQCLLERVRVGAVGAQDGVDDLLEEAAAGAVGVQDAHRRDGDGQRRVVLDQLGQALLRLVVLRGEAHVELILLAPQLTGVGLVLEPGEDLHGCQPSAAHLSSAINACWRGFGRAHRLQLARPSELLRLQLAGLARVLED